MVVRQMVAGKHPVVIRLTDTEYSAIVKIGAEHLMTPNEYIVELCRREIAKETDKTK